MTFYDAHNHLHDSRLTPYLAGIEMELEAIGVGAVVVNGTSPADWPQVVDLARASRLPIIPSYGLHPWEWTSAPRDWADLLRAALDRDPTAGVGEIGLDRWKSDLPWDGQEAVFATQLAIAAEYNRPASIHCLRAWGACVERLTTGPLPVRGVLLHSFSGSMEVAERLIACGAYFSFCGAFMREKQVRTRAVFQALPLDRILVETDAPDQCPPRPQITHPLSDEAGQPLNHPAHLVAVYQALADLRGMPLADLCARVAANFRRLFGPIHSAGR